MFSKYFQTLEKRLSKKPAASKKGKAKKETPGKGSKAIKTAAPVVDIDAFKDDLNKIIPSRLKIDALKMVDPSGYCPEDVDLIAYKELYRDISGIMDGFIPCELVYGTFHITSMLNKESLNRMLRSVIQAKKINRFTERAENVSVIPAFVIAYDTDFKIPDLKSVLLENYMSMSIDNVSEIDIIVVLNKGLLIKDWRDKRTYVGLETGKDTLMWFFILMNEYLEVEKDTEFDPRNYVKHTEKYTEY